MILIKVSQLNPETFARQKRKNLTQSSKRTQSVAWKLSLEAKLGNQVRTEASETTEFKYY
jgi:hypothetical protein